MDLAAALNGDEDQEALGFALTSATGKTELTGKVRIAGEELSLKGSYEHRCVRCMPQADRRVPVGWRGGPGGLSSTTRPRPPTYTLTPDHLHQPEYPTLST